VKKKPDLSTTENASQLFKVLHVDDDEDFLIISKRQFEKLGQFQVETAFSVNEALKKLLRTSSMSSYATATCLKGTGWNCSKNFAATEMKHNFFSSPENAEKISLTRRWSLELTSSSAKIGHAT